MYNVSQDSCVLPVYISLSPFVASKLSGQVDDCCAVARGAVAPDPPSYLFIQKVDLDASTPASFINSVHLHRPLAIAWKRVRAHGQELLNRPGRRRRRRHQSADSRVGSTIFTNY